MVFMNKLTGNRPRSLEMKDDIINQVDNFHQYSKFVPDLILGYLVIMWINDSPSPVMLYISSYLKNLTNIYLKKTEK